MQPLMNPPSFLQVIGLVAAGVMPFWNIPLILKILERKSSRDLSLAWVTGVEICVLAMLPSAVLSPDWILKIFGVLNAILFTCVFTVVWIYRSRP